jgi:S-adenosylmethionine/arginine decarboxylase-like enzyme
MIYHHHLLVKFNTDTPPKKKKTLYNVFIRLVKLIRMVILINPKIAYVSDKGNEGLTGICLIKTSHISCHIWEKHSPPVVHLDVYSCKKFNYKLVLTFLKHNLKAYNIKYKFLDRNFL